MLFCTNSKLSTSLDYRFFNVWINSLHCVKSVRIRRFCGPYFPAFGLNTERYGYTEYLSLNAGKYGPEKLLIWKLFTQC